LGTSKLEFIQINCGKRIAAMAIMESNVHGKIALIQEPYTSIRGCAMLHKRDYYSSSTPAGSATTGMAVASTTGSPPALSAPWTSIRPRAAIYAPGRSDVLPVYRFTSRDVATVAIQLGKEALFILSVYLDITKRVRSPELISLLDWCRSQGTPLIIGMDCNSHSYLYSDMKNNRGIELENMVSENGLEIHNSGLVPTFAGAGPNGTLNKN
jgi:hypothetical protein